MTEGPGIDAVCEPYLNERNGSFIHGHYTFIFKIQLGHSSDTAALAVAKKMPAQSRRMQEMDLFNEMNA